MSIIHSTYEVNFRKAEQCVRKLELQMKYYVRIAEKISKLKIKRENFQAIVIMQFKLEKHKLLNICAIPYFFWDALFLQDLINAGFVAPIFTICYPKQPILFREDI